MYLRTQFFRFETYYDKNNGWHLHIGPDTVAKKLWFAIWWCKPCDAGVSIFGKDILYIPFKRK